MRDTARWKFRSQAAKREADPTSSGRKLSHVPGHCSQRIQSWQALVIIRKKKKWGRKRGRSSTESRTFHFLLKKGERGRSKANTAK